MKRKLILIILFIITCFSILGCGNSESIIKEKNIEKQYLNDDIAVIADETITMRDIADFLEGKKEHYPLSDEFIEKYQQKSGGYIDNAKKAGLVVDKQQHEPNQKWHFFESWLYPTIEEGMSWEASAKDRVYTKLLCPELLLWIYEACEVDPVKVKAAKEVAEQGKVDGIAVTTIAKNMRGVVSWSDLEPAILDFKNNSTPAINYSVSITQDEAYTISKLQSQYRESSEVSFVITVTDITKQIDTVTANGVVLTPTGNTYKFKMPATDVVIEVTLKDRDINYPTTNLSSALYNVVYDLGTRKTAKQLESTSDAFNALQFAGEGSGMIINVSYMEYIYGGGNGGSSDNKWYAGNMLKFGTTSVNGTLTLELNTLVNGVKITGYSTKTDAKIQIGDANSLDWVGETDGKTIVHQCSDLTLTSKEAVEGNQTSTITLYFDATMTLQIATTNKKPIYITAIEFIAATSE